MPFPDLEFVQSSLNMLIQDEISYDIQSLNEEHQNLNPTMTDEQNVVFYQVIQRGTLYQIVHVSLHSSDLWRHCKVLKLTKNMQLRTDMNDSDQQQIRDFADWILKIGEGKINEPNDDEADVEFPTEMLLKIYGNAISTIVNSTYPTVPDHLGDGNFFSSKAILAPTNEEVDSINEHILSSTDDEERVYYSSDSLTPDEENETWAQQVYSPESKGLCNSTRLLVEWMGDHTIEARIITDHFFGNMAYIARMVIAPTDRKIAIKFQRRQFPIVVCFTMTINKSQGQSLSNVGLYLSKPVFSHGQLYVTVSRVIAKKG
ncbi:ATP-dependent DNA helicase PIF1-like [Rutidosis leptorrhynchoides]|uniref:ATP-dependent DNA helicase PIF1-like n=1 Tax=Rutidosis leptorrhynchoides TaxID=125765 RepID=UPI003A9926D5